MGFTMYQNYREGLFGTSIFVLCRGGNCTVSLFGRVHYQRFHCVLVRLYIHIQSNLSIMNPGYNELPDITNIDFRMYTYLLYVNEP